MTRSRSGAKVTVRNRCDAARIEPQFMPLVEEAIAAYIELFADRVLDIRLQGSVARGEALVGQSDIDFMGLLDQCPSDDEMERLRQRAEDLGQRYPIVSRVELDAVSEESLLPFQRFVLASDSLSMYGMDRLTRRVQRIDRIALARLVTPDAAAMVADFRALIHELDADLEALRFYSRIVAKDLLKCVRFLVLLRGGAYEVTVDRMSQHVAILVPELAKFADDLAGLYRRPSDDAAVVLALLDEAETTLLPLMNAVEV